MNIAYIALFKAGYRLVRPTMIRLLEKERNDGDANTGDSLALVIWLLDRLAGRPNDPNLSQSS